MDNAIRTNLVTTFCCTDCGQALRLSYEPKTGARLVDSGFAVTGAAKVEHRIYIEPCRTCVGEARKPVALLKEALASL